MLTGRVAFAGETVSDSIARVLEREPDWSALPEATPEPIRRLLLRVLTKDPKKRLRDIGDVRMEFDAIDAKVPTIIGVKPPTHATLSSFPLWIALVAFGVGVGVWELGRPAIIGEKPIATTPLPLADAAFTPLTDWPGTEEGAEISPDGNSVLTSKRYARDLDEVRRLGEFAKRGTVSERRRDGAMARGTGAGSAQSNRSC